MARKQPGPRVFQAAPNPPELTPGGPGLTDPQSVPPRTVTPPSPGARPLDTNPPRPTPAGNAPVLTAPTRKPTQVVTRRPK